jgi:hypothetical protein
MQTLTEEIFRKTSSPVFTDKEIDPSWKITDNARYALLKRAVRSHEVIRLRRGLYMLSKEYRKRDIHPFAVAQYIHGPSYISFETALAFHSWIPEAVYSIDSVSLSAPKEFLNPAGKFSYTHIPQEDLYCAVDRIFQENGTFFIATPLKALADIIYRDKKEWQGFLPLRESLRIDDHFLAMITIEACDELILNYRNVRVKSFMRSVKKELKKCR